MNKKMTFSLVAGGLISVAALYYSFRNVPFGKLVTYFSSINYFWLVPSVMLVLLAFVIRALRWRTILMSVASLSFRRAYHPLMIGFMMNCILPARIGELARPAILQQKDNVPFTTGIATVAAERVFDLLFLIGLFAGVFSFITIDESIDMRFGSYHLNRETLEVIFSGMIKACLVLIAGIVIISIDFTRRLINRAIMGLPDILFFTRPAFRKKIKSALCERLTSIVDNIAAGFSLVKNFKGIAFCMFFSLLIWMIHALSYYVMTLGCPGIELSFLENTAVMIIICLFIALPSVPGFWGLWEAGGVFALSIFAVSSKDAAGYALASHAVQMFPVIIAGLASAVFYGINIRQIKYENNKSIDQDVYHGNT